MCEEKKVERIHLLLVPSHGEIECVSTWTLPLVSLASHLSVISWLTLILARIPKNLPQIWIYLPQTKTHLISTIAHLNRLIMYLLPLAVHLRHLVIHMDLISFHLALLIIHLKHMVQLIVHLTHSAIRPCHPVVPVVQSLPRSTLSTLASRP